jgi:UDP-N-acetyl-D-glucosamine dehydrogenase
MKYSLSQINKKRYQIPENLDDSVYIDRFLSLHPGKRLVVVQGLGFVGSVMSLIVSNSLLEDYSVIGIDLPYEQTYWKIASLNEGVFPIISTDKKVDEYFQEARLKNNLYATYDPYVYSKADVVIVDINLDIKKQWNANREMSGFDVNLDGFKAAMTLIASSCKEYILLLVESTVPPGMCEQVIKPIFESEFKKRGFSNSFRIGHSYERVMPGPNYIDSIQNFFRVYSGVDEESANATKKFLKTIINTDNYPLTRLHNTTATEMGKVLENSYRAMNIAFIQEWTEFAETAGVNLVEVITAIRKRPTHKNIMMPGLGVGGYCLTKDPLLASWSSKNIFACKGLFQSEAAVSINDRMPNHTFNVINKMFGSDLKYKRLLLVGVSYLSDVGDTRFTPVEFLYDRLKEANASIVLFDPYVSYWEEKRVSVYSRFINIVKKDFDGIILCTGHSVLKENGEFLDYLLKVENNIIVDTLSFLTDQDIRKISKNNSIKVIGRGDF